MVESSCHHAIFDDGGLALGYVPPLAAPAAAAVAAQPAQRGDVRGGGGGHAAHLSGGGAALAPSPSSMCFTPLWPTEPSNRSGGSEKHAPISDIIYYNSNVWHSTL